MPVVAIYNKAGKLVLFMDGPEDQIRLNVPKGGRFKRVPIERMMRLPKPKEPKP